MVAMMLSLTANCFRWLVQKERELNDDNYHDYITNMNYFKEFEVL